jgi:guanylate kinase
VQNKEHTLLCVLGRSGVGKDSIVDKLCERTGLKKLISYTTRPRRENEGNTHIFVTDEEYDEMFANGQVAAYTEINGYRYWSTIDQLMDADVYIIDPVGVETLKKLEISNLRLVTVYIHIPDNLREYRAVNLRGDNKSTFRSRSFSEREQFRKLEKDVDYYYSIQNLDFAKSYSVLRWIATIEGVMKTKQNDLDGDE